MHRGIHICNVPLRTPTVCINAYNNQIPDANTIQQAEIICKTLSDTRMPTNLESSLNSVSLVESVSTPLILQVLKRLNNSGIMALSFFRWAERKKGFQYAPECYNALIESLGKIKQFKIVWSLVEEMNSKGFLCKDTFSIVSRRFARARKVNEAIEAFERMDKKYGLKPELHDYNWLLDTLSKSRNVQTAQVVFDKWKNRRFIPDIKSYTILLEGWGQESNFLRLNEVYHEMGADGFELDVVGYCILINAHCKAKKYDESVNLFHEMERKNIEPTPHIYCTLINGLGSEMRLDEAIKFFQLYKGSNCIIEIPTYNAMVGAYCWSMRWHDAYRTVNEMMKRGIGPNTRTYDIILHHLVKCNRTHEAHDVFLKMSVESGCEPTISTYEIMIRMFCNKGCLDMALGIWELMKTRGVIPGLQMFSVLINSLCDDNQLADACKYLEEMVELGIRPPDRLFKRLKQCLMYQGREDIVIVLAHKIEKLRKIPLVD